MTATATDIAGALKSKVVSTTIKKPDLANAIVSVSEIQKQSEGNADPCPFCTRTGFKNRSLHINQCVLNPKRKEATTACAKCGVDFPNKSIKRHEAQCDGDAANSRYKRAAYLDREKRKAKAFRDGKEFKPVHNGKKRRELKGGRLLKTTKAENKKANSRPDYQPNLEAVAEITREMSIDNFIAQMQQRVLGTDITFRQFSEWEAATLMLWNIKEEK